MASNLAIEDPKETEPKIVTAGSPLGTLATLPLEVRKMIYLQHWAAPATLKQSTSPQRLALLVSSSTIHEEANFAFYEHDLAACRLDIEGHHKNDAQSIGALLFEDPATDVEATPEFGLDCYLRAIVPEGGLLPSRFIGRRVVPWQYVKHLDVSYHMQHESLISDPRTEQQLGSFFDILCEQATRLESVTIELATLTETSWISPAKRVVQGLASSVLRNKNVRTVEVAINLRDMTLRPLSLSTHHTEKVTKSLLAFMETSLEEAGTYFEVNPFEVVWKFQGVEPISSSVSTMRVLFWTADVEDAATRDGTSPPGRHIIQTFNLRRP